MRTQRFGEFIGQHGDFVTFRMGSAHDAEQTKRWLTEGDGVAALEFDDGRTRSIAQLRKAWAMLDEIALNTYGVINKKTKRATEIELKEQYSMETGYPVDWSQADADMDTERQFIETILDYCFENDVPFAMKTWDMLSNDYYAQYQALRHRKCVICGKHADIAHCYAVGIGRNREKINHIGNYVMPLCRIHHGQQHNIGIKTFMGRYHIKGIKVTPELARELDLGSWYEYDHNEVYVIRNYAEIEQEGAINE